MDTHSHLPVFSESHFTISPNGFASLSFAPGAILNGEPVVHFPWKQRANLSIFDAENTFGTWSLYAEADKEGRLHLRLEADLKEAPKSLLLQPFIVERLEADHVAQHGRKMGGCAAFVLSDIKKEPVESHAWIAISRTPANQTHTLLLSFPLLQTRVSSFTATLQKGEIMQLSAGTLYDTFDPGTTSFSSATLTLHASDQGHEELMTWAKQQATDYIPNPIKQENGWNSWDYYRWTITEEEVLKNAEFIASDPILSRAIQRIVVDDGWQYCYGEWEANHHFPSGMEYLAKQLNRMGFTPGLWFAPTIVEPHAHFAQLHPEYFATGLSGYPTLAYSCMERKGFILDPTHPDIRVWWEQLFRRYRNFGYHFFKLDFLCWTVKQRRFYDRTTQPGQLMQRILEPIRKGVGQDAELLGCNFNFDGGPGIADYVRISGDIHARWLSTKKNATSIANRFWAHERLWINDPDFLVVRGDETSNDPDLHQLKALLPFVRPDDLNPQGKDYLDSLVDQSAKEAEVLASLVIISGGAINSSDRLPRLNERGLDILRRTVLAKKGPAGIPMDLFTAERPSYWIQKLSSGTHRILLINWLDQPQEFDVDLAKQNIPYAQIRNFWNDDSLSAKNGRLTVSLVPHACLLVECR